MTSSHLPESVSHQQVYIFKIVFPTNQIDCRRVKCKAIDSQDSVTSLTQTSSVMRREMRDLLRSWNDREQPSNTTLNTTSMTTTQQSMSKHYCGSISNRSARPEESTTPKKYLTRLSGYNSTDQLCDREELPTDLSESWSHKELLPNRPELINQ